MDNTETDAWVVMYQHLSGFMVRGRHKVKGRWRLLTDVSKAAVVLGPAFGRHFINSDYGSQFRFKYGTPPAVLRRVMLFGGADGAVMLRLRLLQLGYQQNCYGVWCPGKRP